MPHLGTGTRTGARIHLVVPATLHQHPIVYVPPRIFHMCPKRRTITHRERTFLIPNQKAADSLLIRYRRPGPQVADVPPIALYTPTTVASDVKAAVRPDIMTMVIDTPLIFTMIEAIPDILWTVADQSRS